MKKVQTKALKQLANRLPVSKELVKVGRIILGNTVSLEEKLNSPIVIEDDKRYVKKEPTLIDINHYKRLKKAYSRNKEQGIVDYVQWLDNNNKRLSALFEKIELERVDNQIMNIVQKGAKGFWSNIINFFMSFVLAFQNKNVA